MTFSELEHMRSQLYACRSKEVGLGRRARVALNSSPTLLRQRARCEKLEWG